MPTYNKSGEIRKPGSGRKKNSFSFVNITLAQLMSKFADNNQTIPISRVFARQFWPQLNEQAAEAREIHSNTNISNINENSQSNSGIIIQDLNNQEQAA